MSAQVNKMAQGGMQPGNPHQTEWHKLGGALTMSLGIKQSVAETDASATHKLAVHQDGVR